MRKQGNANESRREAHLPACRVVKGRQCWVQTGLGHSWVSGAEEQMLSQDELAASMETQGVWIHHHSHPSFKVMPHHFQGHTPPEAYLHLWPKDGFAEVLSMALSVAVEAGGYAVAVSQGHHTLLWYVRQLLAGTAFYALVMPSQSRHT